MRDRDKESLRIIKSNNANNYYTCTTRAKNNHNSGEHGRVVPQSTCLPSATQLISLMIFLAV